MLKALAIYKSDLSDIWYVKKFLQQMYMKCNGFLWGSWCTPTFPIPMFFPCQDLPFQLLLFLVWITFCLLTICTKHCLLLPQDTFVNHSCFSHWNYVWECQANLYHECGHATNPEYFKMIIREWDDVLAGEQQTLVYASKTKYIVTKCPFGRFNEILWCVT